ncbi:ATP-binding protein, partial [Microbispora rosea]
MPSGALSDTLVGRHAELALLRGVIDARPSLALVEGEAGIGKSRLVAELFAAPDLAATRRLVGQCEQLQEPLYTALCSGAGAWSPSPSCSREWAAG